MKTLKKISLILVITLIFTNLQVVATSTLEMIEVAKNSVNLSLNNSPFATTDESYTLSNGDQVPLSFVYQGTTYLPIRKISETLGLEVGWDQSTRSVLLDSPTQQDSNTNQVKTIASMTYNKLTFDLDNNNVQAVALYYDGKYHDAKYSINNMDLTITNPVPFNSSPKVTIYTSTGNTEYRIGKISEPSLNDAQSINYDNLKYVILPGIPSKGFNFPMLVCVPENKLNTSTKQHIFIDTLNIGRFNTKDEFDNLNPEDAIGSAGFASMTASQLGMPLVLPLIPRVGASFSTSETGYVNTYEAALDRDTIFYEEILSGQMYGQEVAIKLSQELIEKGFNPDDFLNIDEQVVNMITHANDYLESYGYELEDKVFMNGFSASGTFVDRFATLQPQVVRAYCAGAAGDDFVLPLKSLGSHDLILPLGISDYKTATGRDFDLAAYNNVARIIQMGKDDTNDVMKYSDCYGDDERAIAYDLWPKTTLGRAQDMFEDFATSGGHGLLVLDEGIKHGSSMEFNQYLLEFYRANLGDNTPVVYPPINASNLDYQLYK